MDTSEELREALLNLEDAKNREVHQHQMAETLLAGLRVLVSTTDIRKVFLKLFDIMRKALDFNDAFVLTMDEDGMLTPIAASNTLYANTLWKPQAMLKRVIAGQAVAAFNTDVIDEWRSQPEAVRQSVCSALHFSMHTHERKALFICTHSIRGHFSRDHLRLARRFSVLTTQALQKFDSETKMADLKKRLDAEAKLAAINQKLIESEKRLARAKKMEALALLAGGVAHDLNNILSGIVSYPELLLMDDSLSPEIKEIIETIQTAGHRAAAVVADLLTITRGVASIKETLNLNHIIKEYLHSPEYKKLIHFHSGVMVDTDLASDLLNIKASRIHIQKTLMNLISNAVEALSYCDGGNIVISTENQYIDRPLKSYEEVRVGEYAVLTISNNGPVISEKDLDRIFEPFYAKKIIGRSGTGLGLSIVWNTVQDHDGYLNVCSDKKGTAFTLYFPITSERMLDQNSKVLFEDYKGNGQKILVVDDEELQRKIAYALLIKLGYKVHAVSSGEEAVEYLKEHTADLVVLDMIMDPGINGLETYKRIIKIQPGQKSIIASGFALTDDVKAAQRLGAGQYIRKPYILEKIGIAIKDEL